MPTPIAALFLTAASQAVPAPVPERIVVTADPSESGEASVVVSPEPAAESATQAVTVVRVRLRRDGDFKDCAVATSSGFQALDERACGVARRIHTLPPMEKPSDGKIYVRPRYEGQRDFLQNVVWRVGS